MRSLLLTLLIGFSASLETNILLKTDQADKCPSQLFTVHCKLKGPHSLLAILWKCVSSDGTTKEREVFCSSGENILNLNCAEGIVMVKFVECTDDTIISSASFNVTTGTGSLMCVDLMSPTVWKSVPFGVGNPSPPDLQISQDASLTEMNIPSIMIRWSAVKNATYFISISPPPPMCKKPCVKKIKRTNLSVLLQVNFEYNITGGTEICSGMLASNETKVNGVILKVPGTVQCNATVSLHGSCPNIQVQWNEYIAILQSTTAITSNVTSYHIWLSTDEEILPILSISPESSLCKQGVCVYKHVLNSVPADINVSMWATNRYGTGLEEYCTVKTITDKNHGESSVPSLDKIVCSVVGVAALITLLVLL